MIRKTVSAGLAIAVLFGLTAFGPFGLRGGGITSGGGGGGTTVDSVTFTNVGSGTTPGSSVPTHMMTNFAPGAVPSGQIAAPSVSGTNIPYQADCAQEGCPTWPDGSLRNAPMSLFLPTMTAGTTAQVVFKTASGSYASGSSITPATIATASHYKLTASNVSSTWIQNAGAAAGILQPPGIAQVGCVTTAGSIATSGGCVIRIAPPSGGSGFGGANCSNGSTCITGSNNTGTVSTTTGSPTVITFTATAPVGAINRALAIDVTTPGNIPANTTVTSKSGSTVTLSSTATITNGDTIAFLYPINGCSNAGWYATLDGSNKLFTAVTVPSYATGSGCGVVGSGTAIFDFNTILNEYGSIVPPTCAAAGGSASFTGTYSGGSLTTSSVTGKVSVGQVITDSVGATAVVTAGSASPWTVSGALTNGAMTGFVPACVYANGPAMTGIRLQGPLVDASSGSADPNGTRVMGWIEYWSNTGTPYSVRGGAFVDVATYAPSGTSTQARWPSETFDLDMTNGGSVGGAGEIRGNAQGAGMWTHLTTESPAGFYTFDPALSGPVGVSGRADWLGLTSGAFSESNSLAINSVIIANETAGDLAFFHANHAHMPLKGGTTVTPSVITTSTSNYGFATNLGYYRPLDVPFVDNNTGWNGGGEHFYLSPDSAALAFLYYAWAQAADGGASWLQQLRVSTEEIDGQAEGPHEANNHALNIDPTWTPPAAYTDPVRQWAGVTSNNSFDAQTTMYPSGQQPSSGGATDPTHWPSGNPGAIASIEGERWDIDRLDRQSMGMELGEFDDFNRVASFGGTTYYALVSAAVGERRAMGWALNLIADAVNYMPPSEPNAQWHSHVLAANFKYWSDWYPWVPGGSFCRGINYPGGGPATCQTQGKMDYTALGITTQPVDATAASAGVTIGTDPFMDGYVGMALDKIAMQQNHALANLDTVLGYAVENWMVANAAENTCQYNLLSYTIASGIVGSGSHAPPAGTPNTGWDATDIPPTRSNYPSVAGNTQSLNIETYAGSTFVSPIAGPTNVTSVTQEAQLAANILTTSTSPAGTTITVPSVAGVLPHSVVNDITAGTGPFYVVSAAGTTITLDPSTPTSGITSGDRLFVSHLWDYPIGSGSLFPSGSTVQFTNWDIGQETVPAPAVGTFPPPTTPGGGVAEGTFYTYCQDSTGVSGGTLNPLGTNCASPAPITFSANGAYGAGFVVNATCPAITSGDWNGTGNYASPTGREAEMYAVTQGDILLKGSTTNNALAIAHLTPFVVPVSPTSTFGIQPRWNWDSAY